MVIKLRKTKDSRSPAARHPKYHDADLELLQRLQNEKDQPEFIKYLLQKGYSISSSKGYQKDVTAFKKWLDIENIAEEAVSYNDITHYIQRKKTNAKQITIQKYLSSLKHYYNYLQELGFITENPTLNVQIKGIKRKVLHNILSKQELEKIYHNYKNIETESLSKKRNDIILSMLIYQGLNTNDLQNLTIKDVKLREGKIFIKGSRRSNERTLKLEAHQILDIMEYQLKTRSAILKEKEKHLSPLGGNAQRAKGAFFVSMGSSYNLGNVMHKLIKQLKQQHPKVESVKQIRASVITHWLKVYNLREVQYFAGHRYVSSTENYLINDLEDLKEDVNKYHPIG